MLVSVVDEGPRVAERHLLALRQLAKLYDAGCAKRTEKDFLKGRASGIVSASSAILTLETAQKWKY